MRCVALSLAIIVYACERPALMGDAQHSFQRGLDLYFGYEYERAIGV